MAPQIKKKSGKHLFQPGQSGNPGGRPRIPEPFKQHLSKAVDKILELMDHKNPKIALQAASLVTAYSLGKPTEHHEHDVSESLERLLSVSR